VLYGSLGLLSRHVAKGLDLIGRTRSMAQKHGPPEPTRFEEYSAPLTPCRETLSKSGLGSMAPSRRRPAAVPRELRAREELGGKAAQKGTLGSGT
jgi:hypothetical protein